VPALDVHGFHGLASGTLGKSALAFDHALWWAVGSSGVAIVVSLALPGRPRPAVPIFSIVTALFAKETAMPQDGE